MSLTFRETLASLALGQALLVVPALGDTYEGKTAATVAAMLIMLSADFETIADRRTSTRATLSDFLAHADVGDVALKKDISLLLKGAGSASLDEQYWTMLSAFSLVHAWADENDTALAARCRRLLAEWAESERLDPPAIPLG